MDTRVFLQETERLCPGAVQRSVYLLQLQRVLDGEVYGHVSVERSEIFNVVIAIPVRYHLSFAVD